MLARARAEPSTLVLGIDANAAGMAEAASRASRKPTRGGASNARFLVSAVEGLPETLAGLADEVTVQFPWGSLLRGIIEGDPAVVRPIADLLRPASGDLRLLLSVESRDASLGLAPIDGPAATCVAAAFRTHGLVTSEVRPATVADVAAAHSTWAKRLGAGRGPRQAWLLELRHG